MGAASCALEKVFESCGFISSANSQGSGALMLNGRDVSPDARDPTRPKQGLLLCLDEEEETIVPAKEDSTFPGERKKSGSMASKDQAEAEAKLLPLMQELFDLQDLNKNGVLEELELIKLNEKIAMLHYGKDTDRSAVKQQYKDLFRSKLDPNGEPVPFEKFQVYMHELLDDMDKDRLAQELIMEQFIAEAKSGRLAFHCPSFYSVTDTPFKSKIDSMEMATSKHSPSSERERTPAKAGA
mmetsp:Transcript_80850/g.152818  ORF Transcript_80850/g.152818 Transcript_80850/m.152818 type:complete len:240 (-) Transcript_80850:137-856(-)